MTTRVLAPEEINTIKSLQQKRVQLTEQFGVVELRIQEINLQKDYLIEELKKVRQEEIKIGESLQQKYGEGTINLERGEFTSA